MKAGLIVKLVQAHSSGNDALFKTVLSDLALDEENKGNAALSLSLRNAYHPTMRQDFSTSPLTEMTFHTQDVSPMPRDKDSTLDLIEVIQSKVTLKDVSLPEKVKDVLRTIIEEQTKTEQLLERGIVPTNRILFCGPPGCGKTLTANAIAGELNMPIAYVKLDGMISSYLGQTGTNIRKIFEFVKNKRIMLFLDEFDTIAKKRDDSNELGELKRVVTTFLQNLDAMPANVLLVAATNHHHLLDPAIWRRFNVSILLELPTEKQRMEIINNSLQNILSGYIIDKKILNVLTQGMSGAQIDNFLQSLAKYSIMRTVKEKTISIDEIAIVWLKHTTLFISEDSEDYINALRHLNQIGVPLRTLESITGIPKSTLSYKFDKEVKENA